MKKDSALREQIVNHLHGGEAFMPIDELIKEIPFKKLGIIPKGLPYSIWQQFHHLYLAQQDILAFSQHPGYVSPKWPEGYWLEKASPDNEQQWKDTIMAYHKDRETLSQMVLDSQNDLMEPFPHGSGQTLLREVLLVIEHTAYHTGELLIILRLLGLR